MNTTNIDSHIENLRRQLEQAEAVKQSIAQAQRIEMAKEIDELIKQKEQICNVQFCLSREIYEKFTAAMKVWHEMEYRRKQETLELQLKKLQCLMPKEVILHYTKTYELHKIFDLDTMIPNYSCPSNNPIAKVYMRHFVHCGVHPLYVARLMRSTYQTVNRYAHNWGCL